MESTVLDWNQIETEHLKREKSNQNFINLIQNIIGDYNIQRITFLIKGINRRK